MKIRLPHLTLCLAFAFAAVFAVVVPQTALATTEPCPRLCATPAGSNTCSCHCPFPTSTTTCGQYRAEGCNGDALDPTGNESEVDFLQAGSFSQLLEAARPEESSQNIPISTPQKEDGAESPMAPQGWTSRPTR